MKNIQDLEKEVFELEQQLDIPFHLRWHNSKHQQETTLEEVAKQSAVEQFEAGNSAYILGFTEGAKSEAARDYWYAIYQQGFADGSKIQQEKSYSEEEVLELVDVLFHKYSSDFRVSAKIDTKEWFEQFSKLKNG